MEVIVFGDIEAAYAAHLTERLASHGRAVRVLEALPDDRDGEFVRLRRVGGKRRDIVVDSASVTFECYAQSREAACSLAAMVRAEVQATAGTRVSGCLVYRVQEFAAPASLPHPTSPHRYVFTAAVDFRGTTI